MNEVVALYIFYLKKKKTELVLWGFFGGSDSKESAC